MQSRTYPRRKSKDNVRTVVVIKVHLVAQAAIATANARATAETIMDHYAAGLVVLAGRWAR